jgi:hypothetical protein
MWTCFDRMRLTRRTHLQVVHRSAFAGFRFPSDVIVLVMRWYLRFGLSYRDVEELLDCGIAVDHVPAKPITEPSITATNPERPDLRYVTCTVAPRRC